MLPYFKNRKRGEGKSVNFKAFSIVEYVNTQRRGYLHATDGKGIVTTLFYNFNIPLFTH